METLPFQSFVQPLLVWRKLPLGRLQLDQKRVVPRQEKQPVRGTGHSRGVYFESKPTVLFRKRGEQTLKGCLDPRHNRRPAVRPRWKSEKNAFR